MYKIIVEPVAYPDQSHFPWIYSALFIEKQTLSTIETGRTVTKDDGIKAAYNAIDRHRISQRKIDNFKSYVEKNRYEEEWYE